MYDLLALIGFPILFFVAAQHEHMPNAWGWAVGSALVSLVVLGTMGLFFVFPAQAVLFGGLWVYNAKHKARRSERWAAQGEEQRRAVEARKRWAEERMAQERAERAERERNQGS